jgi:acyl carrier protein
MRDTVKTETEALIIAFLSCLPSAAAVGPMTADTAILSSGLLDSLGILELTTFLADTFAIEIGDEDFTTANFGTIGDLVSFVYGKRT